MTRQYFDGPYGQIHTHLWGSQQHSPMICLAPSPSSGASYATLAPLLAERHYVAAMDYPGYGASDATPEDPSIHDYAACAGALASALTSGQKVDLVGFHTGCLVAVESALSFPDLVSRLVLIDVPYFEPDRRKELLQQVGGRKPLPTELSGLTQTWETCVTKRLHYLSLERAYAMFVDQISTGEYANLAFKAAFTYPCQQRFKELAHETIVVATSAGLYETSCEAAQVIPDARLIERKEITVGVLEQGAQRIAETVLDALANKG